jgi:hypothetical protein
MSFRCPYRSLLCGVPWVVSLFRPARDSLAAAPQPIAHSFIFRESSSSSFPSNSRSYALDRGGIPRELGFQVPDGARRLHFERLVPVGTLTLWISPGGTPLLWLGLGTKED